MCRRPEPQVTILHRDSGPALMRAPSVGRLSIPSRYDQRGGKSVSSLGLYALWYQYFLKRWTSPELPEYDFDRDELVYREERGSEIRREPFAPGLSASVYQLDTAGTAR